MLPMTFLVDTGAFNTIIMPTDAARFGVDFLKLTAAKDRVIIGGHSLPVYCIDIWFDLIDRGSVYSYNIKDVRIVDPAMYHVSNPNILGQNSWGRLGLHIQPNKIEIDPLAPDRKTP